MKKSLSKLPLSNIIIKEFPLEENIENKIHTVRSFYYCKTKPTPLKSPTILALSANSFSLLDLNSSEFKDEEADILCGNSLIENSIPISHCYCGYQFGSFAGQLGDGRAITLGDYKNEKNEIWELQLKGAGLTPFSRNADGRAVLRSSIREFLASEAMFALGIPTTRAASIVLSPETILRDPLYNGNVINEMCAVVLRLAPSFIRFGTFEIFLSSDKTGYSSGPSLGLQKEMMPLLLDFVIKYHYQSIFEKFNGEEQYFEFFKEIVGRTSKMVAKWQSVGFCHGVLNTDNMSILGLTVDYGPFGFLDYFDKFNICNSSDDKGRYCYSAQPEICKWNLMKLSEALSPILDESKCKRFILENYSKIFEKEYYGVFLQKIGFSRENPSENEKSLIDTLLDLLRISCLDFTLTFKTLEKFDFNEDISLTIENLMKLMPPHDLFHKIKTPDMKKFELGKLQLLVESNPMISQIYNISQEFISIQIQKNIDYDEIKEETFDQTKDRIRKQMTEWLLKYREAGVPDKGLMKRVNPYYILRNYLAQNAIKDSTNGNHEYLYRLQKCLETPFEYKEEYKEFMELPPEWSKFICVSCSS